MKAARLGLKTAGFRAYLATQFLGAFNDNAYKFLLLSLITATAADDIALQGRLKGLAQALFALPFVLLAPWAGALADKVSKSTIFVRAKLAEIALMAGVGAALWFGSAFWLFALLFLMAAQSTFFGPAKYGYLPETLDERDLSRANGTVNMTTVTAVVLGGVAGGALYDLFEHELQVGALLLVAVAIAGTLTARRVPRVAATDPGRSMGRSLPDLLRTGRQIAADRALLYTILGIGHFYLLGALLQVHLFSYAKSVLGANSAAASAFMATSVVGIALGSLLASRWSERKVELGLVPLGALGMSVFLIVLGLLPAEAGWGFALPCVLLVGLGGGLFIVPLNANLQLLAPDNAKGRFMAFGNLVSFVGVFLSAGVLWLLGELQLDDRMQALAIALFTAGGTVISLITLPEAFLRLIAWLAAHSLYRISTLNAERMPERGGALIVANHVSWIDWLVILASTRRRVSFLIYREYYEWWPVSWMFKVTGCMPLSSKDPPDVVAASIEAAGRRLQEGHVVVIFVEGSVTRTGHLGGVRRGYQRIVQGRGIPIIPVYLDGLWGSVFSHEGGRLFRKLPRRIPYPVTVAFGEPLPDRAEPWQIRTSLQRLASEAWSVRRLGRRPLHVALLHKHRRGTRAALFEDGRRPLSRGAAIAQALALRDAIAPRLGTARHVGLLLPHGIDAAIALLAVMYAGRIPVPLNTTLPPDRLGETLARAGIETVLVRGSAPRHAVPGAARGRLDLDGLDRARLARSARLWRLLNVLLPDNAAEALAVRGERHDMDGVATVIFSAGSTGTPKGVVLSHHNVLAAVQGAEQVLGLREDDRILALLPLFQAAGFAPMFWMPLLGQAGVVFVSDPLDARAVGDAVAHHEASVMLATPRLLDRYVHGVRPDRFGSLRLVFSAGEKLQPVLRAAFNERFGLPPYEAYAATECASIVALNTPDVRAPGVFQRGAREGSVGHPVPGLAVEVVDPVSGEPCPAGTDGLLRVRGPSVMQGYLDDPVRQAAVLREGWYATGDRASIDDEGFVTLTGRFARRSRIDGEIVSHAELEDAIAWQTGRPDGQVVVTGGGEGPSARLKVYYADGRLDPERVLQSLSASGLPPAWLPRVEDFIAVDEIPLLPTGTVDFAALERRAPPAQRA